MSPALRSSLSCGEAAVAVAVVAVAATFFGESNVDARFVVPICVRLRPDLAEEEPFPSMVPLQRFLVPIRAPV